ncbi:ATP-binding cassette domain-containing protein [Cohnella suwonensis]|uniref:ATP-binding cassette domain-containing protein n=1 Tax=Cohnella suwonensis TaxID=696072 RepID=A0ABW0M570_9BACL
MTRRYDNEAVFLNIKGLSWRDGDMGEDAPSLSSGELRLEPGTVTVLIGANGAGKTTLLEKLAGLRPPEGIDVSYGTEPLWTTGRTGRPRLNRQALFRYGYASQSPEDGLFARSLEEEMAYSLKPFRLSEEERRSRTVQALYAVGWEAGGWLERDPYRMSGGERRRAALASVFASPVPWLLLDEPTSGLDGAGHERLAEAILRMKGEGRGLLLVSHDSDWALPLADRVLLLGVDGHVTSCARDRLLERPELIAQAGMAVPEWLRMARFLVRCGISPTDAWRPADAASGWGSLAWIANESGEERSESAEGTEAAENERKHRLVKADGLTDRELPDTAAAGRLSESRRQRGNAPRRHRLAGFDPRAIWLGYALLSAGLFRLGDWTSLAIGAVFVITLLAAGNVSLRKWKGTLVNYAIFTVATSAIFAWGASGGWTFEWGAFGGTMFPFLRTFLIMLLGLAIPLVMSPLSLRKSLERLASYKGRPFGMAQRPILTVTLIMRFVPVLLELWGRFERIFLARGKTISRGPIALGRKLRDVAIPFMLALFRLGDEVVSALQSRGVGDGARAMASPGGKLWRWRDYLLVVGSALAMIGLWALAAVGFDR